MDVDTPDTPDAPDSDSKAFDAGGVTWAVLLGGWVEFAKGAVALPRDGAGGAMRESVADIIALQAVWFALQHLGELDADERALGIDRAAVLIERHAKAVVERWGGEDLPGELAGLIEDARSALAKSQAG
jgi:hypothetical protein